MIHAIRSLINDLFRGGYISGSPEYRSFKNRVTNLKSLGLNRLVERLEQTHMQALLTPRVKKSNRFSEVSEFLSYMETKLQDREMTILGVHLWSAVLKDSSISDYLSRIIEDNRKTGLLNDKDFSKKINIFIEG